MAWTLVQLASGYLRKKIVLMAAKSIKKILAKSGATSNLNAKIDRFIPLKNEWLSARRAQADLFISLHADSIKNGSLRRHCLYPI